jgi:HEAT repeat protein
VDALKEALKDEDLDVQSAAKEALEKIENDSGI